MITFKNINDSVPYRKFKELYDKALQEKQINIEAMSISSYSVDDNLVDSRFVNLKYIYGDDWTFFSNYNGPKSKQFSSHNQVTVLFYWNTIDIQIRIRAKIKKIDNTESDNHFSNRSDLKNALAISSSQSKKVNSYEEVQKKYKDILEDPELLCKRPDYWGGFSFKPYYIEFWQGHESRLNKRQVFELNDSNEWTSYFLEP